MVVSRRARGRVHALLIFARRGGASAVDSIWLVPKLCALVLWCARGCRTHSAPAAGARARGCRVRGAYLRMHGCQVHGARGPLGLWCMVHGAHGSWCLGALVHGAHGPWCLGAVGARCMVPMAHGALGRWCTVHGGHGPWCLGASVHGAGCMDRQHDKDTTMVGHYSAIDV